MAETARQLMGVREYARGRGVSQPYISQLIGAGRIQKYDGKIDKAEVDALLDSVRRKVDGRREGGPGGGRHDIQAAAAAASGPAPAAQGPNASGAYTTARAVRETTLAKIEQLNYRQRIGELAEVDAFRRGVADAYAPMVRELRSMPDRIGGRMHAEANERKARDLLSSEIERTLARIAEIVAALPDSIGKTRQ